MQNPGLSRENLSKKPYQLISEFINPFHSEYWYIGTLANSKVLLFNMGSLHKSPPGMDGTTYFKQSTQCMSITSPIIQSMPILLVTVPS